MKNRGYFDYAKYGSIGISWVLATSIYFYLGYKGGTYLDARLNSAPIFLLIGLLGAVALSLRMLISDIIEMVSKSKDRQDQDGADQSYTSAPDREKNNKNPQEPR